MKKESNEQKAFNLKNEFEGAKDVYSKELKDTKEKFRDAVIESAEKNGEKEEFKAADLTDANKQKEEAEKVKSAEKKKHSKFKTLLFSVLGVAAAVGVIGGIFGLVKPNNEIQDNTPEYSEVEEQDPNGGKDTGDQGDPGEEGNGTNQQGGQGTHKPTTPDNPITPNYSGAGGDPAGTGIHEGESETTNGTTNRIPVEDDGNNTGINKPSDNGQNYTGMGDGITAGTNNGPVETPSNNTPIPPSDPEIPATIDPNNSVPVTSTPSEKPQPSKPAETPAPVKTEEPQQADDKTLDEMLKLTGGNVVLQSNSVQTYNSVVPQQNATIEEPVKTEGPQEATDKELDEMYDMTR